MFKQSRKDTTGAEGIGLESNEDEDRRREWMTGILQVCIELRYQRSWKVHGEEDMLESRPLSTLDVVKHVAVRRST